MLVLFIFLTFCTVGLIGYSVAPAIYGNFTVVSERRRQKFSNRMELLVPQAEAKKISRLFVIAPVVLAGGFYFLFPEEIKLFGVVVGLLAGLIFPGMYVQVLTKRTKEKFSGQLVDALMIMSSSFRGGIKFGAGLRGGC